MRRALSVLAGLVVAGVSSTAHAGSDECVDAATEGQTLRNHGDLTGARARFVTCGQATCPAVVADACHGWLADVDRRTPTFVFRAVDEAGADVARVKISIDAGKEIDALAGRAIAVNPGAHKVRFSREGHSTLERDLVFAEAEKERLVVVEWPRALAPVPPPPVTAQAETKRAALPTSFWILASVSGLSLGTSAYFGLSGIFDARDLRSSCGPRCAPEELDDVKRTALVADVALVVGLVAAAAATWIAIDHGSRSSSAAAISAPR